MSRRLFKSLPIATLALVALSAVIAVSAAADLPLQSVTQRSERPDPRGRFFVPVTHGKTGFGRFRETPEGAALARRVFGPPSSVGHRYGGSTCLLRWRSLGIVAAFTSYAIEELEPACLRGVFSSARLTDPRWHTAAGVRPGSRARKARQSAVRFCGHTRIHAGYFCPATGYVLGWHHSECAATLIPNVIAHIRGHRVVSLLIYTHGCE